MQLDYIDNQNPLLTIPEHLSFVKNNDIIDMSFIGQNIHYPIQENTIYTLIRNFLYFTSFMTVIYKLLRAIKFVLMIYWKNSINGY